MKKAAVEAIANLIDEDELNPDYCIPGPFDKRVAPSVARSCKSSNGNWRGKN